MNSSGQSRYSHYFNADHLQDGLNKKAIKGGGITVISRFIVYLVQMGGTIILSRILAPEDFGLIAMVTSLTGFFMVFQDMGLSDATIQKKDITHQQVSNLFWINTLFGFGFAVLTIVFAPVISLLYKEPKLTMIAVIFSTNFIFLCLSIQHQALLKRGMFFKRVAVVEIVATFLSSVIAIIAAILEFGYWAIVIRFLLYSFFYLVAICIVSKWVPSRPSRKTSVRSFLLFGANLSGYYFMKYFSKNIDKTLIGWKFGAHELGLYSKAYSLFLMPLNQLIFPLQNVAVVTLSKLQDDHQRFIRYFLNAIETICILTTPFCFYLSIESTDIIRMIIGEQWFKTGEILSVLAVGAAMQILYGTQGWLFVSLGRPDKWFRWGILDSILNIASYIIGLFFGVMGVAVAYIIVIYILVFPGMHYAGQEIGLKVSMIIKTIWKYFVCSAIAAVICFILLNFVFSSSNPLINILYTLPVFIGVYVLTLIIFFRGVQPFRQVMSHFLKMIDNK
ncbi:MAG: lipopolysaccharide biosynthesis protein [Spirochaetales bacterium]|nr:lipopolysaccharide biosynthesis protein [Spirochaetales bacterium]